MDGIPLWTGVAVMAAHFSRSHCAHGHLPVASAAMDCFSGVSVGRLQSGHAARSLYVALASSNCCLFGERVVRPVPHPDFAVTTRGNIFPNSIAAVFIRVIRVI